MWESWLSDNRERCRLGWERVGNFFLNVLKFKFLSNPVLIKGKKSAVSLSPNSHPWWPCQYRSGWIVFPFFTPSLVTLSSPRNQREVFQSLPVSHFKAFPFQFLWNPIYLVHADFLALTFFPLFLFKFPPWPSLIQEATMPSYRWWTSIKITSSPPALWTPTTSRPLCSLTPRVARERGSTTKQEVPMSYMRA